MRFVTDEVEAMIGIGRLEDAESLLAWYEGLAEGSARMGALAACARCRGLLLLARGEIDSALEALASSLELYRSVTEPLGLARTLLVLGAIERRRLHRRAARETLGAALAQFEHLGARLWANAARAELARIGGRVASPDALTPTEERVAALVAEGRTNREVGAILVVSERTVEGHLSRIYAKIGVRSRAELAHRLTGDVIPGHSQGLVAAKSGGTCLWAGRHPPTVLYAARHGRPVPQEGTSDVSRTDRLRR